jgi:hypothetical protein
MKSSKLGILFSLVFLVLAACSGEETYNEKLSVKPVEVVGSVSGIVYSGITNEPLEAVDVTIMTGATAITTVTDANGMYFFTDLPTTGQLVLLYDVAGFYGGRQLIQFPETYGDFPIRDPALSIDPIWLLSKNGTLRFKVTNSYGEPVEGHPVQISFNCSYMIQNNNTNDLSCMGDFDLVANTNALGIVEFQEIPLASEVGADNFDNVDYFVPFVDLDGDGYPEYSSAGGTVSLRDTQGSIHYINLPVYGSETAISISNSNYPALQGSTNLKFPNAIAPGGTLWMEFNTEPDNLNIIIYDIAGVSTPVTGTINGRNVSVVIPNTLDNTQMYYIYVYATNKMGGATVERAVPLFLVPPATLEVSNIVFDNTTNQFFVTFNQPIGQGSTNLSITPDNYTPVYYDHDFGGTPPGSIGDFTGEYGWYSSTYDFLYDSILDDVDTYPNFLPSGLYGSVYFHTTWKFNGTFALGSLIPPNTTIYLEFFRISNSTYSLYTVDGRNIIETIAVNSPN